MVTPRSKFSCVTNSISNKKESLSGGKVESGEIKSPTSHYNGKFETLRHWVSTTKCVCTFKRKNCKSSLV